ncbi:NAD dependent epimerase/dehydratase [Hyaloscypha variabilis F]|uniref:NAD dependent epimerase/dehydratase n=1 Tax=Hyaloscypha variabilis (strain UAMH 11265 / GT02V1 / F) TaxID=1149755 RepID=A0A2J6RZE3_HYAVF|nr:NAD dependent epimerase/dehydratase [Hyaloscypha variabilis F]
MSNQEKKVFVTGATGFICAHIIQLLVERGYQTIASVRSPSKSESLFALHPAWKEHVSFVYVPDIATPGAFDDVFKSEKVGFDYIIHTASPVNFAIEDVKEDLLKPAIQGTLELMKAAHNLGGPQIKTFVLLSSAVAVLDSAQDMSFAGRDYTEEDWNTVTEEEAIKTQSSLLGYNASKKLSEQAAWDFMASQKPGFTLTVINPDIIIGPMLQPIDGPRAINESNLFAVYDFFNGKYKDVEFVSFPFYHFVDVRDVALAHVLSLEIPKAANQRIILVSDLITPQLVVNIIRKHFPQLHNRIAEGNPDQILPKGVHPTGWNRSKSFEIFGDGWGYVGLEKSLVDTVKSILDLEKKWRM